MPKLLHVQPKYRLHRASGQAVVTLNGRDHYLGPWKSKASKAEYDRLIGEWLAAGRWPPATTSDLTVVELVRRYWEFARGYYIKHGRPTDEQAGIRVALRFLREGYGVMDATAVSLCMENKLPILVFNLREEGNIRRVVTGEHIGTVIH